MIVRILGEGQLQLPDDQLAELNLIDATLTAAVANGEDEVFSRALTTLLGRVRAVATPLPDDVLAVSDFIMPGPDSTLAEVRAMLGEDGLIPG